MRRGRVARDEVHGRGRAMTRREASGTALLGFAASGAAVLGAPLSMSILDYIKQTWSVLTRSSRNLAAAAADPKFRPLPDGRWPVYVPRNEDLPRIEQELRREMPAGDFQKIDIRQLPTEP